MFKMYSKGCQYAIRALVFAGGHGAGARIGAREMCEQADIPESFTRKVLQSLVQGGFLQAQRGPGGGYVLTRDPREISLLEVIKAVDGEDHFEQCVLGFPECSGANPCPLHAVWLQSKQPLMKNLAESTLHDLAIVAQKRKARMTG